MRITFTPTQREPSDLRQRFSWTVTAEDDLKLGISVAAHGSSSTEAFSLCLSRVLVELSDLLLRGKLDVVPRESGPLILDLPVEKPRKEIP